MENVKFKPVIGLVVMVTSLGIAFTTNDVINSQLFASVGIIAGIFASRKLSNSNAENYE